MPLAHEVAIELRKLADSLDREPDAVIHSGRTMFYCETKEEFISIAKLLPRPMKKSEDSGDERWKRIAVEHENPAMNVKASIPKSLTCELVEPARPAVYRCAPILSLEEDAALEVSNG